MSRALAEAGVPQIGMFWIDPRDESITWEPRPRDNWRRFCAERGIVCAYTASELGAMLPKDLPFTAEIGQNENGTSYVEREAGLCVIHYEGQWEIFYIRNGRNITALPRGTADTEADARAALLLALIDAEHVDPETLTHA